MLGTDVNLTTLAIAGDADALNRLLCKYDGPLRARIGRKIDKHRSVHIELDDVLQVTYVEAFIRIRQFQRRGPGSFLAWLTRIARNNLSDAFRADRADEGRGVVTHRGPGNGHSRDWLISDVSGSGVTASRHLARADEHRILEQALVSLPPDYETVLRMTYLDGVTNAETAAAMNRSAAAVGMLKARAKVRLAEILRESQFFCDSA